MKKCRAESNHDGTCKDRKSKAPARSREQRSTLRFARTADSQGYLYVPANYSIPR